VISVELRAAGEGGTEEEICDGGQHWGHLGGVVVGRFDAPHMGINIESVDSG
jgi:hypothetical protein